MCDLEDKILKKNIPGKYSWWEKEKDDLGGMTSEVRGVLGLGFCVCGELGNEWGV